MGFITASQAQQIIGGRTPIVQPQATTSVQNNVPQDQRSVGGFLGNILRSGGQAVTGIGGALLNILNPNLEKNTIANLARIGIGAGELLIPGEQGAEQYARNVGNLYNQRYGITDILKGDLGAAGQKIGTTLYEDPVGAALDISAVVGGAGGAVSKLGKLSKAESLVATGRNLSKVGATVDPLQALGRVIKRRLPDVGEQSNVLKGAGGSVREGVRQIRQPASIYGAKAEAKINADLNKLGFKGTPAEQYRQLEPTLNVLEDRISSVIKENPEVFIPKKNIKASFLENLKSSLRSKDLTNKQATSEVNGYLSDLIKASGGTGRFTNLSLQKLRDLKKLVNQDYGPVADIVSRGGTLSPRQKVIQAAWDSLDGAVKKASPEMKELLSQESSLYKAAPSLSRARSNPPTLRAFGTSIPAPITSKGQDFIGRLLSKTGNQLPGTSRAITENISKGESVGNLLRLLNSRSVSEQAQNEGYSAQNYSGQNNTDGNFNQVSPIIPQGQQPPVAQQQIFLTGRSPEQHYRAYQKAIANGDTKAASQIYKAFEDETAYQKSGVKKPTSAAGLQVEGKAKAGINALQEISSQIANNPAVIALSVVPGSPGARQYEAAVSSLTDAIGGLRTGASVSKEQQRYYRNLLPKIGDSQETIAYKLKSIQDELNSYLQGSVGVQDQIVQ